MYFKPMLADHVVLESLKYPCLCSYKLDGVRCINFNGRAYSRSLKLIPNSFIQEQFELLKDLPYLDGELIVGDPTSNNCFRNTTSSVMKKEGIPKFTYYVFDVVPQKTELDLPYTTRFDKGLCEQLNKIPFIKIVNQVVVKSPEELFWYERRAIDFGYEGIMIRHDLPYKFGRSTNREAILLKLKRYADSEAKILSIHPLLSNQNEAKRSVLGKVERSNNKIGMVEKELLGHFVVKDLTTGQIFSLGSGFTEEERKRLWLKRLLLTDKIVKYKYFPVGQKEAPRHPVFLGFRDRRDL